MTATGGSPPNTRPREEALALASRLIAAHRLPAPPHRDERPLFDVGGYRTALRRPPIVELSPRRGLRRLGWIGRSGIERFPATPWPRLLWAHLTGRVSALLRSKLHHEHWDWLARVRPNVAPPPEHGACRCDVPPYPMPLPLPLPSVEHRK